MRFDGPVVPLVAPEMMRLTSAWEPSSRPGAFHLAPGLLLKFLVWALQVSDYFGCLPGSITHLSHFHGSLYITFMASLGIPPIFHRLYDFGNVPVFWSFGRKRQAFEYQWDGTVARRR